MSPPSTKPPKNIENQKDNNKLPAKAKRKWRLVSQWEKEETDYEMYLRIKESNQKKEKKKSDRAIKKLKKEGKVQSIAGFLVTKEEAEDSWITSKRDRFVAKRGRTRVSKKDVPPPPKTAPPPIQHSFSEFDSQSSDEEDVLFEDILNFRPFRNALNKPIVRKRNT